jgi:triphosphoribosyl-dephospho-CoA synthetase
MPLPDDSWGEPCTATWPQDALELLPLYLSGGQVAELAVRAAILEAAVSPKPGLVCLGSNGAHSDMDYPLFVRSAKALRPYFAHAHALGQSTHGLAPEQVFVRLRPLGLRAEQDMLRATAGVNTHKGLIFSMGLFCAALGRLGANTGSDTGVNLGVISGRRLCGQVVTAHALRQEAASFVRGIVQNDFAPLAVHKTKIQSLLRGVVGQNPRYARPVLEARLQRTLTAGEVLYLLYGITGIRGEAERGFPHVGQALHALEAHGAARDLNTAMAHCLLELVQAMDDTNILWRGGPQGLHHAANSARVALAAGGLRTPVGQAALRRMSADFARKRLSPGGCADILAVSVFLRLLRCHGGV